MNGPAATPKPPPRDRGSSPARQASAEQLRLMWRVTGMAFVLSSEVAAGAGIGWLIDQWQGTHRWMTIGGLIGIVCGMTSFLRAAWKLSRQSAFTSSAPRQTSDQKSTPHHGNHDDRNA